MIYQDYGEVYEDLHIGDRATLPDKQHTVVTITSSTWCVDYHEHFYGTTGGGWYSSQLHLVN